MCMSMMYNVAIVAIWQDNSMICPGSWCSVGNFGNFANACDVIKKDHTMPLQNHKRTLQFTLCSIAIILKQWIDIFLNLQGFFFYKKQSSSEVTGIQAIFVSCGQLSTNRGVQTKTAEPEMSSKFWK